MLFDLTANKPKHAKKTASALRAGSYTRFLLGKSLKALKTAIGTVQAGECIPYATGGQWSLHELIEYLLRQIGPSEVWLTTWALSENPVRCLANLKDEGLISALHCLFDHRIRNNAVGPLHMLTETADTYGFTKVHAKAAVMIPENDVPFTILTSANLTNNKRIEVGTIIRNAECAEYNKDWIEKEINQQSLLRGTE